MNRKHFSGLAILTLIIGVVGVYFMLQPEPEPEKRYILPSEADNKETKETIQPIAENNQPPREAKDGFTWERHGDHWHEVPIAQNETPSMHPIQENQLKKPAYTDTLTYHEELLKTNPVEALRLQAEERGHWSAKWIPPFPPDDLEAAEIARTEYLLIYYHTIGDTDNPEFKKASRASAEQTRRTAKALRETYNGRVADLIILTWPNFPESDVPPLYEKGWRKSPSDYFPPNIKDLKFPLSNPK